MIKFVVFFFFAIINIAYSENFIQGKIVVKFSEIGYEDFQKKDSRARSLLTDFLGEFSYSPGLNPKLLDYAKRKYFNSFKAVGTDFFESLKRIFILSFDKKIDPFIVSSKIKNDFLLEYVEPLYVRRVSFIPNDSLVPQQYYLKNIKAFESWELLPKDVDSIILAVVDTGVDIEHEDLQSSIFFNYGEIGLDSLGKDKRTNKLDDDNNGYIDDFVGWDFAGVDNKTPDNNPIPGNGHGTHVAGIIGAVVNNGLGIAGVNPKVKIMALKAASDNIFNTYISFGYEAIFYAGVMGAKVINCSWGSESASNLENDVIKAVNLLGACVVAAAGNNGRYSDFSPASFDGVLSVAAVDSVDVKAGFSNFGSRVDVSAPGVKVMSTVPNNGYASWDGTSMASPVAAGVLSLVRQKFPYLDHNQVYSLVKSQSDKIDSLNPLFSGLIGEGRVNAFKSLSCNPDTIRYVELISYFVEDEDNDGILLPGELIRLNLSVISYLSDLKNVYAKILAPIPNIGYISKDSAFLGNLLRKNIAKSLNSFDFTLSEKVPIDFLLRFPISVFDSIGYVNKFNVELSVNPSYRTMNFNNIGTTFNSQGNIGFNDYPQNKQGIGFHFKTSRNILFEGGLLLGYEGGKVYDCVRSSNQMHQSKNFVIDTLFSISPFPDFYLGTTTFVTLPDSLNFNEFKIKQRVIQPFSSKDSNFILIFYEIENLSERNFDSLFLGLFFDWDIGFNGKQDRVVYDFEYDIAIAFNTDSDTLPFVGIRLLTEQALNFYAIDNDGEGEDSVGIYDGFSKAEKWNMMSRGILRSKSRSTDASMLIAAGPISLKSKEKVLVGFSIVSDYSIAGVRKNSIRSAEFAYEKGWINKQPSYTGSDYAVSIFPNPSQDDFLVRVSFLEDIPMELRIFDITGKLISTIPMDYTDKGTKVFETNLGLNEFPSGMYFLRILTSKGTKVVKLLKLK
ncbi:MAG: S8 family serine peptidase [Ignavibacteria bacterium]|nr:S8 family serine peptidase [Ignavibacteria bacterium]